MQRLAKGFILLSMAFLLTAGVALGQVTLVNSGSPAAAIITAPSPSGVITKAAQEFQKHIELMSGATLPIDVVGNEVNYSGYNFVYIGTNTASTTAGVTNSGLTNEFFKVVTVSTDEVHIVGMDAGNGDWWDLSDCQPGTLFGVYYVLGEILNCRWIWPGDLGIYAPQSSTISIPETDLTDGPAMVERNYRIPRIGKCYLSGLETYGFGIPILPTSSTRKQELSDEEYLWLRRHQMGARQDTAFAHYFLSWWTLYSSTDPEYFATPYTGYSQPWPAIDRVKLCVSNPDVWDQRITEWGGGNDRINCCPNDSRGFCVCTDCKAWDSPSQADATVWSSSDALLGTRYAKFYNEIADLADDIRGTALVYGYAYDVYKDPPDTASVTVANNVAIAYIPGATSDTYTSAIAETDTNVLGWMDAGCQYMYLRPNWFLSAHCGPFWPLDRVGDHYTGLIDGGDFLGFDQDSSNSSYACMGPYLYEICRMTVDPTLTSEDVKDEYCEAFAPADTEVLAYLDYWEDFIYAEADADNTNILAWADCVPAYDDTYTTAVFDDAEDILDAAYAALGPNDTDAQDRLDFLKLGLDHGRLTSAAIGLVHATDPITSNPDCEAAMLDLLEFRDDNAESWAIWREWFIDREASYVPNMGNYWKYIFAGKATGDSPADGYVEDSGMVVIEAEHYYSKQAGTGSFTAYTWELDTDTVDASGGECMEALPNNEVSTASTDDGPRIDYKVVFTTTGTFYCHVRVPNVGGSDNSLQTGQNDIMKLIRVENTSGAWKWCSTNYVASKITMDIMEPGVHYFQMWMREDGMLVDKIVMTTNASYTLTGTDTGPAESDTYVGAYTLTVNSGTGDGNYDEDEVVGISADNPAQGYAFDEWTGDTAYVANVNSANSTVTMPAGNVTVTATFKQADTFIEADGMVVMEAEHYSSKAVGTSPYDSYGWELDTDTAGASVYCMEGLPNNAINAGDGTAGPVLNFKINFSTTGVYYALMHMPGLGGGDNSVNAGMDGSIFQSNWNHTAGEWRWPKAANSKTITTTGVHTFNIYMREDGVIVDKFILTTNASYALAGTDLGPDESDREGSGTPTYTLTVTSGTGDGDYEEDAVQQIVADSPPANYTWNQWAGDTAYVANVNSSTTNVTMPAQAVSVTATYTEDPKYTLTVTSGTGDGSYYEDQQVGITADSPPANYHFDEWTGDVAYVANVNSASTTVTMPAQNIAVTATYEEDPQYTLTVNSGTGDGSYYEDEEVGITADAPDTGYVFDEWTGDTAYVANVNSSSTTVTMPAQNITVTATYAAAGGGAFVESSGMVVMETENYTSKAAGTGSYTAYAWQLNTSTSGDSGDCMEALPDNSVNTGDGSDGPVLDFQVNFSTTGVYYMLLRMPDLANSDDGVNIGLDDSVTRNKIENKVSGWSWEKDSATVTVSSTGYHTFNIWMREDGVIVDKVVLTTNSGYSLTGTDTGPAESSTE
jgi:uncharacterized repeat protein (TIGR02543 family)